MYKNIIFFISILFASLTSALTVNQSSIITGDSINFTCTNTWNYVIIFNESWSPYDNISCTDSSVVFASWQIYNYFSYEYTSSFTWTLFADFVSYFPSSYVLGFDSFSVSNTPIIPWYSYWQIIESHSISYHVFQFISDHVLFFGANIPWLIMLFLWFATVGLLLSWFFHHKNRI